MLESTRTGIKTLLGSAVLSLGCAFIFGAITTYGITSVGLARIFLFLAGIILVVGIVTCDYLCGKSWKHYCVVGSISAVIVFVGFWRLDDWAVKLKAEQNRIANIPPPILPNKITNVPLPPFAFVKTPKPESLINEVHGNQNVTGNTVTGNGKVIGAQVCPNGICIGGDNSGNPTVNNYGPPQPNFVATSSPSEPLQSSEQGTYKTKVTIKADREAEHLSFRLAFDGPYLKAEVSDSYTRTIAYASSAGEMNGHPALQFSMTYPSTLPINGEIYVIVFSNQPLKPIHLERGP